MNQDKPILRAASRLATGCTTAERFSDGEGSCGAAIEPGVAGRTAFDARVQTGASEPWPYCIIPWQTRGECRQRARRSVVRWRRHQHAGRVQGDRAGSRCAPGSWRPRLTPQPSLLGAAARVSHPTSACRFGSARLEPMDCTPEIIDLVAGFDRLAPHFHLPPQHASDVDACRPRDVAGTIARYAALVDTHPARECPDAAIGSDVIVGFPVRVRQRLEQLTAYLEGSPLTHVHVFPVFGSARHRGIGDGRKGARPDRAERGPADPRDLERLSTRFRDSQRSGPPIRR